MESNKSYECEICNGVNHATRLHCQHCGTIPKQYSIIGQSCKPASFCWFIPVVNAIGVMRATQKRTFKKSHFVGMPITYYASE